MKQVVKPNSIFKKGFTLMNPTSVSKTFGFTLIELMVVMAILSVLVTVGLVSFRSSQARGRDAQRKSDLKQISNSLELFYSDFQKYPDSAAGILDACPYDPGTNSGSPCSWGAGSFTDGKTVYFKVVPKDPTEGFDYYYRVVDPPLNQKYQLFAFIENTEDPGCVGGDCENSPLSISCGGGKTCNFSIYSPNTTPTE